MRIAIDARELAGRPTGVGRYLGSILAEWAALTGARGHTFVLCATETLDAPAGLNAEVVHAPGRGTAWEQLTLPGLVSRSGADVLFAPGYTGPLRGPIPMVVTIHDVAFAAHPEWFSIREGMRRRLLTKLTAKRAARIITVSDFSKDEIVRHTRVAESKVEVIYSGITRLPPSSMESGDRSAPIVLYVGSLFNRRHIPELLLGFDILAARHPTVHLEVVGDNRTHPVVDVDALVSRSAARGRIRVRSYVPDAELAALYRQARAFVFLSSYEGFALTPMEALGAGVPPVLLATDVAREIYGPAAAYVDAPEPGLIATSLERVLFDEDERTRILQAAHAQMERYSWRECAQRTLQVLLASGRKA